MDKRWEKVYLSVIGVLFTIIIGMFVYFAEKIDDRMTANENKIEALQKEQSDIKDNLQQQLSALGSAVEATQTYTSANVWQLSSALAPTPAGTAAAGAQIKVRLFREGTDGTNDTFTSTSRLVKLQMQYKKTVYGDTVSW